MKTRQGPQAGAATVELAISMLLIIPVFLYVLFLDDLLRYRLDQQEAVVSTLWDYTAINYDVKVQIEPTISQPQGNRSAVQKFARNTYCDHEGGTDSDGTQTVTVTRPDGSQYTTYTDCASTGDANHHASALSSHACWLGVGEQITCTNVLRDVGVVNAADGFSEQYQNGGYFECSGHLEVLNNLVPKKFLQDFSKQDLSKHNFQGDSSTAHEDGESATGQTAYVFAPTRFSLITDPWALNRVETINPDEYATGSAADQRTGPTSNKRRLQHRTQYVFDNVPLLSLAYKGTVAAYMAQGLSQQILMVDPRDMYNANVATGTSLAPTRAIKQEGSNQSYFDSAWQDWGGDRVKKTHDARGNNYMGCKTAEKSGC